MDDLKTKGEWKIKLTMAVNFFFSKDSNLAHTMHTKNDRIEIVIGNETDEIIEELFYSPLQRYQ